MSVCTTSTCPHNRGVFIWLGDGPWHGPNPADPDHGRYPWVHDTTGTDARGHLEVCDLMPFAAPEEAGEVPAADQSQGNMSALRIGSVCSGYEGLGMAVSSVIGGELAWVADIDPGAAAVLAHRFPSAPNLGDITAVNWTAVEPVDVFTAGFPCQDVSQAGARAGLKPGTRSGVWLEVARAIGVLRPQLVVIENVLGLLSARGDDPTTEHLAAEASRDAAVRLLEWLENETVIAVTKGDTRRVRECAARTARVMGLRKRAVARCQWHERRLVRAVGTVLGSLASLGFDAEWQVVSAADAGSCHLRKRVFIIAWPASDAPRVRWRGGCGDMDAAK